jgi:hypothetical protein
LSNDKYLYFTSQSNGGTILNRANIKKKKEALLSEQRYVSRPRHNNTVVYAKTEVENPEYS